MVGSCSDSFFIFGFIHLGGCVLLSTVSQLILGESWSHRSIPGIGMYYNTKPSHYFWNCFNISLLPRLLSPDYFQIVFQVCISFVATCLFFCNLSNSHLVPLNHKTHKLTKYIEIRRKNPFTAPTCGFAIWTWQKTAKMKCTWLIFHNHFKCTTANQTLMATWLKRSQQKI